jgi:hypothetical protein
VKRRDVGGWAKDRGVGGDSKRGGGVIIRELGVPANRQVEQKKKR